MDCSEYQPGTFHNYDLEICIIHYLKAANWVAESSNPDSQLYGENKLATGSRYSILS